MGASWVFLAGPTAVRTSAGAVRKLSTSTVSRGAALPLRSDMTSDWSPVGSAEANWVRAVRYSVSRTIFGQLPVLNLVR